MRGAAGGAGFVSCVSVVSGCFKDAQPEQVASAIEIDRVAIHRISMTLEALRPKLGRRLSLLTESVQSSRNDWWPVRGSASRGVKGHR
jgi:hypothetical protein